MSEAEIADLKDRMAARSRWLKAEIKGREKAEADLAAEREHVAAHCPWPEQPCIYWKQRAAGRESGSRASAPEPDPECGADRGTAAKTAARFNYGRRWG